MIGRLLAILPLLVSAAPVSDQVLAELVPLPVDRLTPGNGWTAQTLPQVHPGAHADAVCIAHWTRVPDQILWRVDGDRFRIGVLAYHRSRIDHVRFAVDGGPWLEVDQMRRSPQTDHYEYSAVLMPGSFTRGWHEVRAVVVPETGARLGGTERVLTWRFYASLGEEADLDYLMRWVDPVNGSDTTGDGTSTSPYASLRRAIDSVAAQPDGARILLRGNGSTPIPIGGSTVVIQNERPITIRRAPGQFPILGPQSGGTVDRLQVGHLRLEELRIDFSVDGLFDRGAVSGVGRLTLANCEVQGFTEPAGQGGPYHTLTPGGVPEPIWMLRGRARDFRGSLSLEWARGIEVSEAEAVVSVQALIDSEIRETVLGFDTNLLIAAEENALVDGVAVVGGATAVGPLGGAATDGTAIVNSLFDGSLGSQFYETVNVFAGTRRHLLLLHCSFPSTHIQVDSTSGFPGPYDLEHGLVYGVIAEFFTDEGSSGFFNNTPSSPSGLDLDPLQVHTHHARPAWSSWTQSTPVDTYVDPAGEDFRVRTSSPAAGRIPSGEAYHQFDMDGAPRGRMTALGALKAEGE